VNLEETISSIESCATIDELRLSCSKSRAYGFAGFNFLDIGRAGTKSRFISAPAGSNGRAIT